MLLSRKKEKANHFRQQMRRCNQLHVEYMTDEHLRKSYEHFVDWQLAYILPLFGDLYARDGYAEAIDFTMSDLAGIGISNRDRDLERAAPAITTILPLRALTTVADTAEVNARVLEINIAIWRRLIAENDQSAQITEYSYCIACREASSFGECLNLVHKITALGKTLKSLIEVPMIGLYPAGNEGARSRGGIRCAAGVPGNGVLYVPARFPTSITSSPKLKFT